MHLMETDSLKVSSLPNLWKISAAEMTTCGLKKKKHLAVVSEICHDLLSSYLQ